MLYYVYLYPLQHILQNLASFYLAWKKCLLLISQTVKFFIYKIHNPDKNWQFIANLQLLRPWSGCWFALRHCFVNSHNNETGGARMCNYCTMYRSAVRFSLINPDSAECSELHVIVKASPSFRNHRSQSIALIVVYHLGNGRSIRFHLFCVHSLVLYVLISCAC